MCACARTQGPTRCPEDTLPGGLSLDLDLPMYDTYGGTNDSAGVVGLRLLCYQVGAAAIESDRGSWMH
jgi:hypothetical protein